MFLFRFIGRLLQVVIKHSLLPEPDIYLSHITRLQPRQTRGSSLNPQFDSRTVSSSLFTFLWQVKPVRPAAQCTGSTDTILAYPSRLPLQLTDRVTTWLTDRWSILQAFNNLAATALPTGLQPLGKSLASSTFSSAALSLCRWDRLQMLLIFISGLCGLSLCYWLSFSYNTSLFMTPDTKTPHTRFLS